MLGNIFKMVSSYFSSLHLQFLSLLFCLIFQKISQHFSTLTFLLPSIVYVWGDAFNMETVKQVGIFMQEEGKAYREVGSFPLRYNIQFGSKLKELESLLQQCVELVNEKCAKYDSVSNCEALMPMQNETYKQIEEKVRSLDIFDAGRKRHRRDTLETLSTVGSTLLGSDNFYKDITRVRDGLNGAMNELDKTLNGSINLNANVHDEMINKIILKHSRDMLNSVGREVTSFVEKVKNIYSNHLEVFHELGLKNIIDDALRESNITLDPDQRLLLETFNLSNGYHKNLNLNTKIESGVLVISIEIPIVEKCVYTKYETFKIPTRVKEEWVVFEPEADFVLFSNGTSELISVSQREKCKSINANLSICSGAKTVDFEQSCELSILSNIAFDKMIDICSKITTKRRIATHIYHINSNTYLISTNKPTAIKADCSKQEQERSVGGSTILNMIPKCTYVVEGQKLMGFFSTPVVVKSINLTSSRFDAQKKAVHDIKFNNKTDSLYLQVLGEMMSSRTKLLDLIEANKAPIEKGIQVAGMLLPAIILVVALCFVRKFYGCISCCIPARCCFRKNKSKFIYVSSDFIAKCEDPPTYAEIFK